MLRRHARIVNVAIAVLIGLIAVALYWYTIRPLPKTSGEIKAPIGGPATISRDALGVPHIDASSWPDAIFLQGYVTAQDRLWQMDGLRRFSAGELAEIFGPSMLPSDERSRRMRMRATAETDARRLGPEERSVLVAYARGVNKFIDTHRGNYSLEFSLPGMSYDPRHWELTDSVLVGLAMFRDLTDSSKFEFAKGQLMARADTTRVRTLFPAVRGEFVNPGSNAWAVSGAHTADRKPMLANDPHLAYSIPGTWYLVHLKAPELNVSGATIPGLPCIITGHNEQIAWGVTNLEADVLDIYREQMDARNGQYVFRGKLEQAELDHQRISVKGSKPVELNVWVTRHGPVIDSHNGQNFTMRWSAADGFGFPFFEINRAQNWREFRSALEQYWGPGQNFVYADNAGNIGYQAAGRVPIRRAFDGDVPLDGASGRFEWDGYIPFQQMPSIYNPASGIIATANQNPFPPDFAYHVDGNFADRYRVDQIRALLDAQNNLTIRDMLAIQKDVYSAYDYFLAQQIVRARPERLSNDQILNDAMAVLSGWNGQMEKDEAAPMITELLSREIGDALVRSLVNPASADVPDIRPRPQAIERLLKLRPRGWVGNEDWNSWLMKRFVSALQAGRELQGSDVSNWKWGKMLEWKLAHPIGRRLPLFNDFFNIGPVEMSGSGTTVKQTTAVIGPSERMVVDLGDLDKSVQNLTVGESGFVASRHYKDQWAAYYAGQSFPMQFHHVNAKEVLHVTPER